MKVPNHDDEKGMRLIDARVSARRNDARDRRADEIQPHSHPNGILTPFAIEDYSFYKRKINTLRVELIDTKSSLAVAVVGVVVLALALIVTSLEVYRLKGIVDAQPLIQPVQQIELKAVR